MLLYSLSFFSQTMCPLTVNVSTCYVLVGNKKLVATTNTNPHTFIYTYLCNVTHSCNISLPPLTNILAEVYILRAHMWASPRVCHI